MRMPPIIQDFLAWRWAPCAALTAGSIAFVGLAVLLIPSQFEAARSAESVSVFDRPASGSQAIYSASLAQGAALAQNAVAPRAAEAVPPRLRAQPIIPAVPQVRGFSPVLARPEPPPAPPEAAPPPAPITPPAPPVPADAVPAPAPPPPEADAPHREN